MKEFSTEEINSRIPTEIPEHIDRNPIPQGDDPNEYLQASELNKIVKFLDENTSFIKELMQNSNELHFDVNNYSTYNLIVTDNLKNKNAFKSLSLKGLWKGRGFWLQTLAYTSFNSKLSLVIRDKDNTNIFSIVNYPLSIGVNEIPLTSALCEGILFVDFSEADTFQEIVNYPFQENAILDITNYAVKPDHIGEYQIIADFHDIVFPNKILATDNSQVSDTEYSITDFIPVVKEMQLTYVGVNTANSSYFDLAHIYDKYGRIVQKINHGGINGFYQFEVLAENAATIRLVVNIANSSEFKLINNTEKARPKIFDYEELEVNLISGSGVAFDGSLHNSDSWNRTGLIKVKPNSTIGYVGYLSLIYSVALYDANKRFIKSVIRPTGAEAVIIADYFITTEDTMYIQASVANNFYFKIFYIDKDDSNTYPTVWQGFKNGEDFKLKNGVSFKKQSEELDDWERVIEANNKANLIHNYLISNRDYSVLKNKGRIEKITNTPKNGVIFGYEKTGNINTIFESTDGGLTYRELFSITDQKLGYIDPKMIVNADGVLYIQGEIKEEFYTYAEKVLYRAEKNNGIWEVEEVLNMNHGPANSYVTFSLGWGFSFYQNIVVINDYGTQGVAGRLWVSEDFGKTFDEKLNIYNPPYNTWLNNGHIHGSAYDYIFNRIWVSTGDGYTNTYLLYSDDLGNSWNKSQVPYKSEQGVNSIHTQFTGILVTEDYVLFNHDSERAGIYRYNRGDKNSKPIVEWVIDVTNHESNEMEEAGLYAGNSIVRKDGVVYALIGWHDIDIANSKNILGKILISKDGYNWDVFYQDTINPVTGRGYITNASLIFVNAENVIFNTEGNNWVYINLPIF
ncbi:hypothetical protein [Algoriella sp.]|uniref:hypothetical protein n=1 Tax=Algoriella sp. TaxID=1872434 RepID=UPI002FCA3CB1